MKITLWGINYGPESIGIAPFNQELCSYLAGRGHDVTAVTAFSYYPHWRKSATDRGRWHRKDVIENVKVHRCWCYVPAVVTSARRIAHELSFGLASLLRILLLPRADVYVVVSPPLVLGFFAWIATALKRSRFVFHVQDLQPDAAVGLGMLKHGWLIRALYKLEAVAYKKAAVVSGISEGMIRAFEEKRVPSQKRVLLPNWLRTSLPPAAMDRVAARKFFGVEGDSLLAVYSGNLGRKQNLEILIEAAFLLLDRPATGAKVQMIIAGDGATRAELERQLQAHADVGVRLLPLLSDEHYTSLLRAADVALITQAAGTGQFFFPSKLLSVLAAGLPVLAVADETSEVSRAILAGGFGRSVQAGDAGGLAEILRDLSRSPNLLKTWAERTIWVRQFAPETILPRFESTLSSVARGQGLTPSEQEPAQKQALV